jgi:four helix bundle protein
MISSSTCTPPRATFRLKRFGLQAQIRRASVSTPSNIVERSVRKSDKHYLRFLEISPGSACEARYLIALCVRLVPLGEKDCQPLISGYTDVIKGLAALSWSPRQGVAKRRRREPIAESSRLEPHPHPQLDLSCGCDGAPHPAEAGKRRLAIGRT